MTLRTFKSSVLRKPPTAGLMAGWTHESIRPTVLDQILEAHFVIGELSRKIQDGLRIAEFCHLRNLLKPATLIKWESINLYFVPVKSCICKINGLACDQERSIFVVYSRPI